MSTFLGLRSQLRAGVDAVWGERIRLDYIDNARADATRPAVEIIGVLRSEKLEPRSSSGRGQQLTVPQLASGAVLRLTPNEPAAANLRVGDFVVALDRPGQPRWRVLSIDVRSHLRLIIRLGDA
jgi:hypothetical protein